MQVCLQALASAVGYACIHSQGDWRSLASLFGPQSIKILAALLFQELEIFSKNQAIFLIFFMLDGYVS